MSWYSFDNVANSNLKWPASKLNAIPVARFDCAPDDKMYPPASNFIHIARDRPFLQSDGLLMQSSARELI